MKRTKKIISMVLALSVSMVMSTSVFAAEPDVTSYVNESGEIVYTQTFDMNDVIVPYTNYATTSSKTVTASSSLGLALDPGASGTSLPVNFRFSTLPTNAMVRSITIKPGTGIINNNNQNMLGAVLFNQIVITSPQSETATLAWNPRGMTDTSSFLNESAQGTWTAYVKGTNITKPTGDPLWDLRAFGSLNYKSVQMTISYVVE